MHSPTDAKNVKQSQDQLATYFTCSWQVTNYGAFWSGTFTMLFYATKSLVGHENNANYPFNSCTVWAGFVIHPEKG